MSDKPKVLTSGEVVQQLLAQLRVERGIKAEALKRLTKVLNNQEEIADPLMEIELIMDILKQGKENV